MVDVYLVGGYVRDEILGIQSKNTLIILWASAPHIEYEYYIKYDDEKILLFQIENDVLFLVAFNISSMERIIERVGIDKAAIDWGVK